MRWCNRLNDVLMQSQHPTPTVPGGSAQTAAKRPPATPPCHTSVRPGLPSFLPCLSVLYSPPPAENSSTNGLCMPPPPHSLSLSLSERVSCLPRRQCRRHSSHSSIHGCWLPGGGLCAGIVARGSHVVKDISQSMPDLHFVLAPVSCNKKSD